MALVHADRVKETSTTTGTGTYDLAGAPTGFRTFVAGIGNGNTCWYMATDGTDWEIGIGTVTDASPDTLARTTIKASSNSDNAVSWGAGTKTIVCTIGAKNFHGIDSFNNVQQVYTGPATWTKPAGLVGVRVTVLGPGAAGGDATSPNSSTTAVGVGGGRGGYGISDFIPAPSIPGPQPVAVPTSGTVSFGPFKSATAAGPGQPGGTASGPGLNAPAVPGSPTPPTPSTSALKGGDGAPSPLGRGGEGGFRGSGGAANGEAGQGWGTGGGGGVKLAPSTPGNATGGPSSQGVVIVEEIY